MIYDATKSFSVTLYFDAIRRVRCPGHTIQFSGYGYSKYFRKTLELLGITNASLDWRKHESWTPYGGSEGEAAQFKSQPLVSFLARQRNLNLLSAGGNEFGYLRRNENRQGKTEG